MNAERIRISVIIPTHNRPEALRRTLDALAGQGLSPDTFEVIVVDDGSDEAHRVRVREFAPPFPYRLVEKPQGGLASARNLGAEHARGEILHFLDDDVTPEKDTLEQHLRSHDAEDEPVAVVGSLPYPPHVEMTAFLKYLEHVGHYDLYSNPKKYPGGRPPLPPMNGNSSISRALFERVGRYDERFRQYGSEDLELGHRLALADVRFVYNPQAVGYHDHVKNFTQFCSDMEVAGESLIGIYARYPEIKQSKKIDIVEDGFLELPGKKRIVKLIMSGTMAFPWILALPRSIIRWGESRPRFHRFLFPFYRWVGHHHYAVGMRRGLAARR